MSEGASCPVGGQLEVDQIVRDDIVNTSVVGNEGHAVPFAFDGQQTRAERLGEADAARVRGGRVACERSSGRS